LEIVAIVAAVLGVLVGFLLVFVTSDEGYDTGHPYVGLGFGLAAVSVVSGMFNWCIARALQLYAEHTAAVHAATPAPSSSGRHTAWAAGRAIGHARSGTARPA
jgi:hypothetical protein